MSSATAISQRETALRAAEKLRKQMRKVVNVIKIIKDVRNKYSLPDAFIVRLLPKLPTPKPPRRHRRPGTKSPPPFDPIKQLKRAREGAMRSGRRLAVELAGLEERVPVQLLLLKCAAVVVLHYLSLRQEQQVIAIEKNTKMVMCLDPILREKEKILQVAYDKQKLALALKEGNCGAGRFDDDDDDDDENEPLPIVNDMDLVARFTFDDLYSLFPIIAHGSAQELGQEIEKLEAQKLILRDHGKNSGNPMHLNNLPLTAEIPTEYVHGGRAGMRLWMERTVPKVFANKQFLKALDLRGIQSLRTLTNMDIDELAELVIVGLNRKKKGTRRRQDELSQAVSGLRIGLRGDYSIQRRSVVFRFSKRTGAVLYTMLLKGLSEANSKVPGKNSYCSGCKFGLVAHNWDCGTSQMDLLVARFKTTQEHRRHRPLPRSDDKEMEAELTWYEALKKRLHLDRGWGFGANPRDVIIPTKTIAKRKKDWETIQHQAIANAKQNGIEWEKNRQRTLNIGMRRIDKERKNDTESIHQRFVTSPRIHGEKLAPLPTRYSVWVKPETATQRLGGQSNHKSGGRLFMGEPHLDPWGRKLNPSTFNIHVQDDNKVSLRIKTKRTDPMLEFLRLKRGTKIDVEEETKESKSSSGQIKGLLTVVLLEYGGVDVIGEYTTQRMKSVKHGVIQG